MLLFVAIIFSVLFLIISLKAMGTIDTTQLVFALVFLAVVTVLISLFFYFGINKYLPLLNDLTTELYTRINCEEDHSVVCKDIIKRYPK